MRLALSTTINDANRSNLPALRCTVRRLMLPNPTSRVAHPLSRHPSRWTPGKPPAIPHVAAPHLPTGIRPRGQHTGNSGPEQAALPILRSSPADPAHRGRAAFPGHHHPSLGNPPATPCSPHAGSLSAWQNPPAARPLPSPHGDARVRSARAARQTPPSAGVRGDAPPGRARELLPHG